MPRLHKHKLLPPPFLPQILHTTMSWKHKGPPAVNLFSSFSDHLLVFGKLQVSVVMDTQQLLGCVRITSRTGQNSLQTSMEKMVLKVIV